MINAFAELLLQILKRHSLPKSFKNHSFLQIWGLLDVFFFFSFKTPIKSISDNQENMKQVFPTRAYFTGEHNFHESLLWISSVCHKKWSSEWSQLDQGQFYCTQRQVHSHARDDKIQQKQWNLFFMGHLYLCWSLTTKLSDRKLRNFMQTKIMSSRWTIRSCWD